MTGNVPSTTALSPLFLALVLNHPPAFIFCRDREHPIRRFEAFQSSRLTKNSLPRFEGTARPGEFFVYQVGIYALQRIPSIKLEFSSLKGTRGGIKRNAARCLSLGGIGPDGKPFRKHLTIAESSLEPLWCGWDIPKNAHGTYSGTMKLNLGHGGIEMIPLRITVQGEPVADHGAGVPNTLSRLRWMDSTVGQGDTIIKPFVAFRSSNREIHVLGRTLKIVATGLPAQIISHFSQANTKVVIAGKLLLNSPIRLIVEGIRGERVFSGRLGAVTTSESMSTWTATGRADGLSYSLHGRMDFTGSGQIAIRLKAKRNMDVKDIRLEIPYAKDSATYMMGLNRKGGLRPASHEWKWDAARHQDCFWLGAVNAGLMVRLKDDKFHRPLVNIYYKFDPLRMPNSWANHGKGGVRILEKGNAVLASAYSGARRLKKGETLDFIADIYITPFRTINTDKQWSTRFIHPHPSRSPESLDKALEEADPIKGPNVINIHQATYYNPYINYPYSPDSFADFSAFVAKAHAKGVRARVYYTTREITQNMPEFIALHALNGEVMYPGPGADARTLIHPKGPDPWLIDNLGEEFIPAWVDHVGGKYAENDISVITTPDSRWNNFYLAGLKWMVDKAKIDGVYIDDTALDAQSLQRARRILAARPDPLIDLHSWNHFNEWAGYANNLNIYMEVLPYLDRLWLGEGFPATEAPWDYWLVEMSGLPFGLMSEMLDSPSPGRGLVFGETDRLGWSGDPRGVWKAWDEFDIKGTEMIPFFDSQCPARTDNPNVLATVYKGKDHTLIAIASWAHSASEVKLTVDWKAIGLVPGSTQILIPEVNGLQHARKIGADLKITLAPGEGILLTLKEQRMIEN